MPVKLSPRRYSPSQQDAIRDFCKTDEGSIIRKSKSPWAAPLVLTPKKTPNPTKSPIWRICVDYRQLNKLKKKHAHPLPNAQDEIQRAAGHKCYAFLDLENGFWQIPLHESSREKTAFVTPFGLYEWNFMPFGLCNAPATFQSLMEEVLQPFRSFVAGLLDDVCVWSDSIKNLHSCLLLIFERFVKYGLILNSRKCRLFVREGIFLGFHVSESGISADPQQVAAIRDRPMPRTTSEIRGFVNAAGYLRSLIKDFSKIAGPLTDQSVGPKNAPVTLSEKSIASWQKIKNAISSAPVIQKFDWMLPTVLESDASQKFVGAALLQPKLHAHNDRQQSVLHPVAYFSRKLNPTQQRYLSQERELLGILLAVQHWRHWIEGGDITVVTDHESLKTIHMKSDLPPRMLRFLDTIEHYNIRILYRPGKANVLADYLSRPTEDAFPILTEDYLADTMNDRDTVEIPGEKIKYPHQLNRIDLQCIFEFLVLGHVLPPKIGEAWAKEHFAIYTNKLHFIMNHAQDATDPLSPPGIATLLLVPEYDELVNLISTIHENYGHASIGTTMRRAGQRYWHPELMLAANEAVLNCHSCQLMKAPDPALGNLVPILSAPPLTRWGIDHTQIGSQILLHAVEYATGWLESRLVPSTDFSNTVPLLTYISHTFGTPKQIISDNASCFTGADAKQFQAKHKLLFTHTTPTRPRSNGKVEKANGVLKAILTRTLLDDPNVRLDDALCRAVSIYNRQISPNGYSPFFLLFGTQPPMEELTYPFYTREPTEQEDLDWAKELARSHAAPTARSYVASIKATRDQTRAYLFIYLFYFILNHFVFSLEAMTICAPICRNIKPSCALTLPATGSSELVRGDTSSSHFMTDLGLSQRVMQIIPTH
ncbi:hypothetical protein K3495_g1237 [Podosphaera aphanis]|nr:hypothetical protein K3495_g1237 [Podosphaera aphanis]